MRNPCVKELAFTFILILVSMSWGLTMGYWSSAQSTFERDFGISSDSNLGTVFNLLAPGACILGGPLINPVLARTGRRLASVLVALIAVIAWIATGLCEFLPDKPRHFWVPCVLRCLLGITVGATSSVTPMYITELAPEDLRGAFGPLHQFGVSLGASMCYGLGLRHRLDWSGVAYFSCLPPGLHLLLVWMVPESPAVARGESTRSLREFGRPMVVSVMLMFFQQFGGPSAFLANLQNILDRSGVAIDSALASLFVGVAGAVAAFIGAPLIGALGRKVVWNVSSALQAVVLATAALQEKYEWSNVLPIVCLLLDNFVFGIGTAPIPWFVVPELFPDSVRATASAIITAICWVMGTVLFFLWQVMVKGIGQAGGFGVFAGIMSASFVFGIVWLPEPKVEDMLDIDPTSQLKSTDGEDNA
jgi:MFS family permease